jgi:UPF0716 protein FxsA
VALVLVSLFVLLPLAELFVIVAVAQSIGVWETFLAMLLLSIFGALVVRREGLSIWRRATEQFNAGRVPAKELTDGLLLLAGGALLLIPGFITDFFGLLLLLPPIRALIRPLLSMLFIGRIGRTGRVAFVGMRGAGAAARRVRRNPAGFRSSGQYPGGQDMGGQYTYGESWAEVVDVEVNEPPAIDVPRSASSADTSEEPGHTGA